MKVHEFTKLENKLGLQTRNSGDRLAWLEYEGIVVVRTKRSQGNKDLPEHLIRQQLKVNETQFSGLISCSVSKTDYIEILKGKGLIPAPAVSRPPQS